MKILQLCPHFHPCIGGIERHVADLCRNLRKMGHQSDVVCLDTCAYEKDKLPDYQMYDGINIWRIPYLNLKIYKIAPTVLRFIGDYDILHIHGLGFFSDFLVLTKFIHRKPIILSTHGGIFHTPNFSFIKKFYFNLWCKFILKNVDCVIAVSKTDERLFLKIVSKVKLIPNAIENESFTGLVRNVEENTFLYVGRISKNKRIDNLIKTFYFLKNEIPNIKLYIIGGDWEGIRDDLERLSEEKGLENNVVFVGGIKENSELLQYYMRANFFVSASEYEGFGISLLEALASGLTVVVNDIEAFRELIENRKNGFIVDYSNPRKSADVILGLMNRDLGDINKNARKTAVKYDWETAIKKIEKTYKGVFK